MTVRKILLLGNPALFTVSELVHQDEREIVKEVVNDLHDTMMDFRASHGWGRAISAPQIGIAKRIVYMHLDQPLVFINPQFSQQSEEMMELWDDCMSFPDLLVRLRRHRKLDVTFRDLSWDEHTLHFEDAMAELIQHEVDHLDGVLAVQRAIDGRSFALQSQREHLEKQK
ncbi:MAG: peptide deformylase [Anaerolineales bacterium]|nr:peptide deformylase [Anaerolineales bacterium]